MEGVAIKDDAADQDMTDPSSSSASSSSCSLSSFARLESHSQSHSSHRLHSSVPQRQPQQPHPASSTATPTSSPGKPFASIKPRPALRPLLPSRPTSPQPINLSRLDMNTPKDPFASKSSSTTGSPDPTSTSSRPSSAGKTRQSAYKINGLNILNRNSLDSRTALEMIRRRRENHNHVERRRRDTLNSTIMQIAEILPNCSSTAKLNKGTILRLALEHLRVSFRQPRNRVLLHPSNVVNIVS